MADLAGANGQRIEVVYEVQPDFIAPQH